MKKKILQKPRQRIQIRFVQCVCVLYMYVCMYVWCVGLVSVYVVSLGVMYKDTLPCSVKQLQIRRYLHGSSLPPAAKTTETAIIATSARKCMPFHQLILGWEPFTASLISSCHRTIS